MFFTVFPNLIELSRNSHLSSFACSAGLKPMQPMRLHWVPRLRGPRAMVVGQVVYFCLILFAHKNCTKTY